MTLPVGLISVFAAVALVTSSAAVGQSQSSSTKSAKSDENKVVCKKQARTVTRFPDKVCRTNAQWEELRNQQLRDAEDLLNTRVINTDRG